MPFLQGETLGARLKREPVSLLFILLEVALEVAAVDPSAGRGLFRLIRGGSYFHGGKTCRWADRLWCPPPNQADHVGFRVALDDRFISSSPLFLAPTPLKEGRCGPGILPRRGYTS